jgi:polysaccharide biosynthesis transport protein
LQRYVEASQQQTVTATEARVLTPASSGSKILPQRNMVLGAALALGLALGSGVAYARERLDRVFRTPNEVERALGIECLGVLPAIDGRTGRKSRSKPQSDGSQGRIMDEDLGILRQVIRTPFSRFAETLRRVKVAADNSSIAGDVRVIGIVSAVPVEGKSTVAANLAQLTAHGNGGQVLLIDADLRNPSLTRAMAPHATAGLLEVLADTAKYEDVVWTDPITELRFLPAVLKGSIANTSEILASRRMADLLHNVRSQYDYIVIDFPPLAPVVDAKAAAQLLDGFLLVIEWGQTPPDAILEVLGSAEVIRSKLVGAVLNRANPRAMKKLESYKGKNYHQYYKSYLSDH